MFDPNGLICTGFGPRSDWEPDVKLLLWSVRRKTTAHKSSSAGVFGGVHPKPCRPGALSTATGLFVSRVQATWLPHQSARPKCFGLKLVSSGPTGGVRPILSRRSMVQLARLKRQRKRLGADLKESTYQTLRAVMSLDLQFCPKMDAKTEF